MNDAGIGKVAIIVLAAGRSSRLGQDKRLVLVDGEQLIRGACRRAIACEAGPVFVVTGDNDATVAARLADLPVAIVTNQNALSGIGSSIKAGISAAAATDIDAAIITVCDQWSVTTDHLLDLIRMARETVAPAVASRYAGEVGVPAIFKRPLFGALCAVAPEKGAKSLLISLGDHLPTVHLPGGEHDIDLPSDLPGGVSLPDL